MDKNGQTWVRPLFFLSKYHIPLYEKLREELFVLVDLNTALSTFPDRFPHYRGYYQKSLYALNDTFILNFGSPEQRFTVITEQGKKTLRLPLLFGEYGAKHLPYTGESP